MRRGKPQMLEVEGITFYNIPRESWHEEEREPSKSALSGALLLLAVVALGGPLLAVAATAIGRLLQ